MIRGEIRVVADNRRKAAAAFGHTNFNRFLRSLAGEGVKLARKWAKIYIYDTPESPSYKRTWRLYKSIGTTVRGDGQILIQSGAPYSKFVHDGTRHMSPRPYLHMALLELKEITLEHAKMFFRGVR